jgi:hypothetical protein
MAIRPEPREETQNRNSGAAERLYEEKEGEHLSLNSLSSYRRSIVSVLNGS